MDDRIEHHGYAIEGAGKLMLYVGDDRFAWEIERPEAGRLRLRGPFRGQDVVLDLSARELSEIPLLARGFRWVSEEPDER